MHYSTFINITFHLAFYHPAIYCKVVLQSYTVSFQFYCFESVHTIINLCSSLFQIIYEGLIIWSIWFILSKLWKRFLWDSLVITLVQKHCLPIPTFFSLSFDGDLLKQGPSFSGGLGGDKLADLLRVSECETKCTLSALHRRAQLGQQRGVLLVPYTGYAPYSRKYLWNERDKRMKDLDFNYLNKKGWLWGVCRCLFGLFLETCSNLMVPDIRFEHTLHSCRLVPEYVFDKQRARYLEIAGTLLSPVLAVLHSTYPLQWEGENFIKIGWRRCWFMGLLWRTWKSFQKSKGKRQCHLCQCLAAMSQWWCEATPTHSTSSS